MAAAFITTASSAISAGSSLAGTTINALTASGGYSVAVGLQVQNWTKYPLVEPKAFSNGGLIETPPVIILPGQMEAMVARKKGWCATGTYGSVSWLVQKKNHKEQRVVIMWSSPYNKDIYDNQLALGITKEGDTTHEREYYDMMYYKDKSKDLPFRFELKKFDTDANEFSMHDSNFEITAGMGTTHVTTAKIIVKPYGGTGYDEYAPSIVKALNVIKKT